MEIRGTEDGAGSLKAAPRLGDNLFVCPVAGCGQPLFIAGEGQFITCQIPGHTRLIRVSNPYEWTERQSQAMRAKEREEEAKRAKEREEEAKRAWRRKRKEQVRAKFEKWWVADNHGDAVCIERTKHGEYIYLRSIGAWLAWQEQERQHEADEKRPGILCNLCGHLPPELDFGGTVRIVDTAEELNQEETR